MSRAIFYGGRLIDPKAKPRTTVPLKGTLTKTQASLDAASVLSVEYAQVWLSRAGSLQVPGSGVMRRALSHYMRHLALADPAIEVSLVGLACKVRITAEEDHRDALLRLHAADPEQPLPPFEVVRDGARKVAERRAMHDRINQLCANRTTETTEA